MLYRFLMFPAVNRIKNQQETIRCQTLRYHYLAIISADVFVSIIADIIQGNRRLTSSWRHTNNGSGMRCRQWELTSQMKEQSAVARYYIRFHLKDATAVRYKDYDLKNLRDWR